MSKINWRAVDSVLGNSSIATRTQFIKNFHNAWPTMSRNKKWKRSELDTYPLCQMKAESMTHVSQCADERAKTCRSIQILELMKKFKATSTDPFITNHIGQLLYQFPSAYTTNPIPISASSSEDFQFKTTRMNSQINLGVQMLLSGFLLCEISEIQIKYMDTLTLQKKPNINSWNRSIIRALLEYSQSIWKFRSDILQNESIFTREAMLRDQATSLLLSLRTTPYRLPSDTRNLLKRTTHYLQSTHLRNVISWTNRINIALETQNFNEKTTSNDIHTWLYSSVITDRRLCSRLKTDDTWYDPHTYDSDDSDMTINFSDKFPDEETSTWITTKKSTVRFITNVVNNLIAPK